MQHLTKEQQKLLNTIIQNKIVTAKTDDTVFSAKNNNIVQIELIELIKSMCLVLLRVKTGEIKNTLLFIENVIKNIEKATDDGEYKKIAHKIQTSTTESIVESFVVNANQILLNAENIEAVFLKQDLFGSELKSLSKIEVELLITITSFFIAKEDGDVSWLIDVQNTEKLTRFFNKTNKSVENFIKYINGIGLEKISVDSSKGINFLIDDTGVIIADSPMPIQTKRLLQSSLMAFVENKNLQKTKAFFPWHNKELLLLDKDVDGIEVDDLQDALNEAGSIIFSRKNEAQESLVTSKPPILAIAGPGAGKTATLIRKIEYEMKSVDLTKMLILTFTNKAAEELKERLRRKVSQNINTEYIGTFHSVFYKLIKKTVYSNWSLILPSDDDEMLSTIMCTKLGVNKKRLAAEAEMVFGGKLGDLKGSISKAIFGCRFLKEEIVGFCAGEYGDAFGDIVETYLEKKHKSAVMNFDDVLRYTLRLLVTNEVWRNNVKKSFELIMVDEFQDTNKIQFAILSYISRKNNVIAVGDPYQSIYAFMNARIENVFDFHDSYQANIIQMILNYRSTGNIVALTNEITNHFSEKIDSEKMTLKPTEAATIVKGKKTLIYPTTSRELTTFELIKKDLINGMHPGEIAVITRLNRDSSKLEKLLTKAGIPFKKRGGPSFFERKESQVILNALRFYIDRYSVSAFENIAIFMEQIGEETVAAVSDLAHMYSSKIDSSLIYDNEKELRQKRRKETLKMLNVFEKYNEPNFEDFINIINELELPDRLCAEASTKADTEEIKENISELIEDIKAIFNAKDVITALDDLMTMLMSKSSSRGDNKAITITTAHSAKGLEWEKVYIVDVSAGNFTECRQDMFQINDEQIRLLYVAVSRAKEELVLIYQTHTATGNKKMLDKVIAKIWETKGEALFRVPENLIQHMPKCARS